MHCYMSIDKKYMVEYSLDMQIKMFWYSVYVKIIKIYFSRSSRSSGSSSNSRRSCSSGRSSRSSYIPI